MRRLLSWVVVQMVWVCCGGVALVGLVSWAGCIDTALGLVVETNQATLTVVNVGTAETPDEQIRVEAAMNIRVGTYALDSRDFSVPKAELYDGGNTYIGQANFSIPADFTGSLEPGQSTNFTLTGTTTSILENNAAAWCGQEINVRIPWNATTGPDAPPEMGADQVTALVTCP